jgi:hypothetical protein
VYYVVPALFGPAEGIWIPPEDYTIGSSLSITYQATDPVSGETHSYSPRYIPGGYRSSPSIRNAFLHADYLIATTPEALFIHYDHDEVNELLSTMAELAKEKNGVLGALPLGAPSYTLKGLISEGGAWYEKLVGSEGAGAFDYLLLVGQADIVPPWPTLRIPAPRLNGYGGQVNLSDYPYANIREDERPELKVGRILGLTAAELTIPIQASIDVANGMADYNASNALLVSGPDDTWEPHVKKIEEAKDILEGRGIVVEVVHTEYYTTKHSMLSEALAIDGEEATEIKGSGAEWDDYTVNELACWLLLVKDEDVIMDQIPYQPSWLNNTIIINNANSYVSRDILDHALELAEEIQAERSNRCGPYEGWTYDYLPSPERVLQERSDEVKNCTPDKCTPDKDIIFFFGHGASDSWGSVLDDWVTSDCPIEPITFGRSRPIVIAMSCLTGDYEHISSDHGASNIARAFMRNNAAAYLGSTELSAVSTNDEVTGEKFWEYWSSTSRIGDTIFDLKTWAIEQNEDIWRLVAYEYNLYGDPKFGGE